MVDSPFPPPENEHAAAGVRNQKTGFWVKDGAIHLALDSQAYSLSRAYATAYAYLDRAWILFERNGDSEIRIWIRPKKEGADLEILAKEFLNELVSVTNYFNNLEANKEVISMIMQRALFSASPQSAPAKPDSPEQNGEDHGRK